jgi:hypothetical protein
VEEFRDQRSIDPSGTQGPLRSVGRGDIHALHGPAGGRAATWFDQTTSVCWFLGFTPNHDYSLFETRAANEELLPDEDDETILEIEQEELDFGLRVGPGLRMLVQKALETPCTAVSGTVGRLLRLEVSAVVEVVETDVLADVYVGVRLPVPMLDSSAPPDWPGSELMKRLAELAVGTDELELDWPEEVPDGNASRAVNHARELVVAVRSWDCS